MSTVWHLTSISTEKAIPAQPLQHKSHPKSKQMSWKRHSRDHKLWSFSSQTLCRQTLFQIFKKKVLCSTACQNDFCVSIGTFHPDPLTASRWGSDPQLCAGHMPEVPNKCHTQMELLIYYQTLTKAKADTPRPVNKLQFSFHRMWWENGKICWCAFWSDSFQHQKGIISSNSCRKGLFQHWNGQLLCMRQRAFLEIRQNPNHYQQMQMELSINDINWNLTSLHDEQRFMDSHWHFKQRYTRFGMAEKTP